MITWKKDPFKSLLNLKKGFHNKIIRIAMNKASAPVKQQVISNAPSLHGSLKKAQRIQIRNYKSKSIWASMVGASKSYKRNVKKKPQYPFKYASGLEHGGKHVLAQPYLKPALQAKYNTYLNVLNLSIKEQVKKILSSGG